jgi:hypothetical protein
VTVPRPESEIISAYLQPSIVNNIHQGTPHLRLKIPHH